ncbi:MAG: hypothetical protein DMF61_07430 [Blastocatellia bacterium AA13]|nr:MAG: hypothetical protein DMF61_07430 [Blastocatellia bacterium AA13]
MFVLLNLVIAQFNGVTGRAVVIRKTQNLVRTGAAPKLFGNANEPLASAIRSRVRRFTGEWAHYALYIRSEPVLRYRSDESAMFLVGEFGKFVCAMDDPDLGLKMK